MGFRDPPPHGVDFFLSRNLDQIHALWILIGGGEQTEGSGPVDILIGITNYLLYI